MHTGQKECLDPNALTPAKCYSKVGSAEIRYLKKDNLEGKISDVEDWVLQAVKDNIQAIVNSIDGLTGLKFYRDEYILTDEASAHQRKDDDASLKLWSIPLVAGFVGIFASAGFFTFRQKMYTKRTKESLSSRNIPAMIYFEKDNSLSITKKESGIIQKSIFSEE